MSRGDCPMKSGLNSIVMSSHVFSPPTFKPTRTLATPDCKCRLLIVESTVCGSQGSLRDREDCEACGVCAHCLLSSPCSPELCHCACTARIVLAKAVHQMYSTLSSLAIVGRKVYLCPLVE
eukprot:4627335-Amphidinium_carterae.2